MIRWVDDILIESLVQPVSDQITRITGAKCYVQATVAACVALIALIGAFFMMAPFFSINVAISPQLGFAGLLTAAMLTTADLLMIWRSRHLARTARPMAASPDRVRFPLWRASALLFVAIQLVVMNGFVSVGLPPSPGSWYVLAHHLAATASMYLMACTPMNPPPKTIRSPVASRA